MKLVEVPQSIGYITLLTWRKKINSTMSFDKEPWYVMDVALDKSFHLRKCLVTIAKVRIIFL